LKISRAALTRRWTGGKSRAQGRERVQLLSFTEERLLLRWITTLTHTGHLAIHTFIKKLDEWKRTNRRTEKRMFHRKIIIDLSATPWKQPESKRRF
jgi:hypothetical protein